MFRLIYCYLRAFFSLFSCFVSQGTTVEDEKDAGITSNAKVKAPVPPNTVGDLDGVGPGSILHMVLKPNRKHAWVPLNAKKAADDAAAAAAEGEEVSTLKVSRWRAHDCLFVVDCTRRHWLFPELLKKCRTS